MGRSHFTYLYSHLPPSTLSLIYPFTLLNLNPNFIFNRRPTQTHAEILVRQTLPNKNLTAFQAVVKLNNNYFPGMMIAVSDTIRAETLIFFILPGLKGRDSSATGKSPGALVCVSLRASAVKTEKDCSFK
ncbi:hypothetical protein KFV02_05325 [Desulfohalobiaceae bacterium Ax17]|uniref:hypothetical protein n=1 Tax=Desulfovulcanus ferrireducens TaxID=2831190 RepID=UPI00207BCA0F|nr:hypothetical protein [Desulfovulcanus ferrireducens]MBT8763347.1 hypothetical protein [Desulfovulcanus ferrireducens]